MPSTKEVLISASIWGFGAMTYTLFVRTVVALDTGRLRHPEAPPIQREVEEGPVAKDIMSKKVISIPPDITVEAIGRILSDNRISGVPVVDEHNRIIGVVSESDIIFYEIYQEPHLVDRLKHVIRPEAHEREAKPGGIASEIMTAPAITAREETPLRELIESITEKKIKRIIIADDEGHPVGVVSRIDIVKVLENI
jgi:CBS domain-containing protein